MPLDPQALEVINLVIKSGRPAYNTLSPKEARQLFRETRPGSTPTPAEIGAVRNLSAEGPGGPIPLRLYRLLKAAPYVTTLSGLDQPWRLLQAYVPRLEVTPVMLGTNYIAYGRVA